MKNIEQLILPRRDTWYVEPDGANLLQCLDDSRTALEREGLPWFARFKSLDSALALLMEQEQSREGYAARASPVRKRMIGYIALRLGRTDLANPLIAEAESELKTIREKVLTLGRRRKSRVDGNQIRSSSES